MVRADRNRPDLYFGRPGTLIKLPWPREGMVAPYGRMTYEFQTGRGQFQVSSLSSGSRSRELNWSALHVDTYHKLEQYWTGQNGAGPWVLIDPSQQNLLRANVSAATGLYNDTRQWKTVTGAANEGSLLSNVDRTFIHREAASRSMRWLFNVAAATTPILTVTPPYRSWFGHPVAPSMPYVFSSWVRADGVVDTSITVSMRMRWLTSAGAQISESTSGDVAVGSWVRMSCIATAPSNAAYVEPRWVVTGSSVTTGGSLYVDEPMLEQDNVLNDWAPGTGVRPVAISSLTDATPFASRFRTDVALILRELSS